MTTKQCKDYGLKCLQCPHWNNWTNFCTKWKITTSTSGDGMTEKRFTIDDESDIIEFDWNTNEYIDDFMWGDGKSWDRVCNRLNELYEENEQLKKELEDWKSNCLSTINENSILWNEIAIMREQGAKPSSAFEEYCSKFKGDVE